MMTPWRRLALATVLYVTAGAGVAAAQTVIVRNAPAGAAVEVMFDAARVATGKADALGDASVPVRLQATSGTSEVDVRVYVDFCGTLRRVGLVERVSLPPTPADGCERKDIPGLFVLKSNTTLLVDTAAQRTTVWVRQGPVPKEWMLKEGEMPERPAGVRRPSPRGLVIFGGGGLTMFRDGLTADCGNVQDCAPKNSGLSYTAGAAVWITRYLAIEGSYIKPKTLKVTGSGTLYTFNSSLETQFVTGAAKIGVPIGPVRFYGIAGIDYHRALRTTTQVNQDSSVTVDDVTTTIPGNTQTFATATSGVGWLFGGGMEGWVTKSFAIYGDITRAKVKGTGLNNTEGAIDDRATFLVAGIRIRLGK
jgi:hypothetical protein